MKNTGIAYEIFVQLLMQAIINSEQFAHQKNIKVEHNKIIKDRCGIDRQFDVYWEYELGGLKYKTVIECRDYNSKISVDHVDGLMGKLHDIPDIKGVIATKLGFQSGAETKAASNGIELLLVRKLNDSDFKDKDGNPQIKSIVVNMHAILPAEIIKFEPVLDIDWIKNYTDFDLSQPISLPACLETEVIIDDLDAEEKYSLHDLRYKLNGEKDKELKYSKKFNNAFLECPNGLKIKLSELNILYKIPNWIESKIEINAEDIFVGVIEYLSSGKKKMIAKDGKVKTIE